MMKINKRMKYLLGVLCSLIIVGGIYWSMENSTQTTMTEQGDDFVVINQSGLQHLRQILQQLNLTTVQTLKVRTIMLTEKPTFQQYMKESVANHQALKPLWSDNYNAETIAMIAADQGRLLSATIQLKLQILDQIYNTLTPEQQQIFMHLITHYQ